MSEKDERGRESEILSEKRVVWQNERQKNQNFSPLFAARMCSYIPNICVYVGLASILAHTYRILFICLFVWMYIRDEEHVCCKVNILHRLHQILVVILLLSALINKTKYKRREEEKNHVEWKNCLISLPFILWYVFACTATQSWQRRRQTQHHDLFHSIRHSSSSINAQSKICVWCDSGSSKKTPSYRSVCVLNSLNQTITSENMPIHATDRLAAELALPKRKMWFCFSLFFVQQHENCEIETE